MNRRKRKNRKFVYENSVNAVADAFKELFEVVYLVDWDAVAKMLDEIEAQPREEPEL